MQLYFQLKISVVLATTLSLIFPLERESSSLVGTKKTIVERSFLTVTTFGLILVTQC